MDRTKALSIVKEQITEKRYIHTIGVMETAIQLAKEYGADQKKAETSAIFHDYAKFRPLDEMKRIIVEQKFDARLLQFNPELWHAPVGAYLVEKEVGIKDAEILNAIHYHTSGRIGMTLLDKIIYLADYIEPGRNFPGVEEARELAHVNLNKALIYSVRNTIQYLLNRNQTVYPDTVDFYNDLVMKGEDVG
ncbi:phosphohydrolase [Heyndrickxia shackletonii]|uniref:bis(5'-nucleosyl)-tetraphosphatase (symmetrical) n=1 Tax=Heyndrickxia shackletonii TaxID=157838 RepID=A0A0Q3WWS1_9BACI|nr:bis(5'-nucleosyl)-tetraphosphatase (symmetrical) YqeK [Heyndrickxia shackletonii]KQL53482.1 phosphohydrolase [Heyndrickxia shackletonii]MBB2480063.1 bis(5'-nucleosyl)-tetraphosphatase (symmetrical) YqeK [Bacillus sp. APMAM]NEY99553.1 HD domain-containing protein [Heyndrickxia shackletonii]RTZ56437.1 HD domain-containing protein [Bacillus sp. SAJ1]